ncbi:MAG TPA: hypothetical protein RMH85_23375 [Polyangiaceae bacterium LLY-WYZ-15_(1-7)]|nr:hypothetical protein [Sandaracinus sp.]HJK99910.1 hypothetical protein [Polyangiaceae bacterium LLY-WYZ-15_(1-7)]HJL11436.1 hypothetical protein [Polyangiaceae bacterium LLY-WYZ-15_(1-7)]HJL24775.1 hypothetical protein [Polyangiaceae bacterium LLY-WYZ-15_(1-7)]HJL35453.1 hypothetical protein [Polyangiaceae bacterium LLY-WYZ-15_(1-7)]
MQYLFADSEPFPWRFDFLETLRDFLRLGGDAANHLAAIDEIERAMQVRAASVEQAKEAIRRFADEAEAGLGTTLLTDTSHPAASELGERILAFVRDATKEKLESEDAELRRGNAEDLKNMEMHRAGVRERLERFLLGSEVGVVHDARLALEGGRYAIEATRRIPGPIDVCFHVDVERFEAWQEPRKVASVSEELEKLQVGMKKKLFRRDMTREMMRVGDHTIVAARIGKERAEIALRRKMDDKRGPVTLVLERQDEGIYAEIERESADGTKLFPAVPGDIEKMTGLWAALAKVGREAMEHRDAILTVHVGETECWADPKPGLLIDRLVEVFAPVVHEIARRSPSPKELSLKIEREDGSREERYLDRGAARGTVEALHPRAARRFAALKL